MVIWKGILLNSFCLKCWQVTNRVMHDLTPWHLVVSPAFCGSHFVVKPVILFQNSKGVSWKYWGMSSLVFRLRWNHLLGESPRRSPAKSYYYNGDHGNKQIVGNKETEGRPRDCVLQFGSMHWKKDFNVISTRDINWGQNGTKSIWGTHSFFKEFGLCALSSQKCTSPAWIEITACEDRELRFPHPPCSWSKLEPETHYLLLQKLKSHYRYLDVSPTAKQQIFRAVLG